MVLVVQILVLETRKIERRNENFQVWVIVL